MDIDRATASLSLELKRIRNRNGLTQEALADRSGVSVRTIAALEAGSLHTPRHATLRLLADALELSEDDAQTLLQLARPAPQAIRYHTPPTNLPAITMSLVGRTQLADQAMALLRQTPLRLLTLIGPAGVGKTRLALHVGQHVLDDFQDGVYFVDLAAITQARQMPNALAATIGLREHGKASLTTRLYETLREKHLLLILDNCEQIADAALFFMDLLADCPTVKLLATSRAPIHVRAEQLLDVPPLPLPSLAPLPTISELAENPAVALFTQRMQAVRPEFMLDAATAPDVAEICVRLDGLPLALELAAARGRLFSLHEIRVRLNERFGLLTDGMRDLSERQRTLRAALDWSYALLDPTDQWCFRRLAVFAGSVALTDIATLCAGPMEEHVLRLLDHSLVQRVPETEPLRITLLESMRAYAWEQLQAEGATKATQAAHAAIFLGLAETAQAKVTTAERPLFLQYLDLDRENVHAALTWYAASAACEQGLRFAATLQWYWTMRGRFTEGRHWLETFLEQDRALGHPASLFARACALAAVGRLAFNQSDYAQASRYEEAALALFTQLHDTRKEAMSWNGLAMIAEKQSRFDEASAAYHQALTRFVDLEDTNYLGRTWLNLGNVAFLRGNLDEAADAYARGVAYLRSSDDSRTLAMAQGNLASLLSERSAFAQAAQLYEEILAIFQQLQDQDNLALTKMNLGYVRFLQGLWDEAEALTTEALQMQRAMQHQRGIAETLKHLGYILQAQGRLDDAEATLWESLLLFQHLASGHGIVTAQVALASVMLEQGATIDATQLLAAALANAQSLTMHLPPRIQGVVDQMQIRVRTLLGEAGYHAAWSMGTAWSVESAMAAVQRYFDGEHTSI